MHFSIILDVCVVQYVAAAIVQLTTSYRTHISIPASTSTGAVLNLCIDASGRGGDRPSLNYSVGAVWLTDQKYVSKGFQFSCNFLCDWVSIHGMCTSVNECSTPI